MSFDPAAVIEGLAALAEMEVASWSDAELRDAAHTAGVRLAHEGGDLLYPREREYRGTLAAAARGLAAARVLGRRVCARGPADDGADTCREDDGYEEEIA